MPYFLLWRKQSASCIHARREIVRICNRREFSAFISPVFASLTLSLSSSRPRCARILMTAGEFWRTSSTRKKGVCAREKKRVRRMKVWFRAWYSRKKTRFLLKYHSAAVRYLYVCADELIWCAARFFHSTISCPLKWCTDAIGGWKILWFPLWICEDYRIFFFQRNSFYIDAITVIHYKYRHIFSLIFTRRFFLFIKSFLS